MTIRRDMIEAVTRAKELLGDSAGAVGHFVRSRQKADGGFAGRTEDSDLYYTVFAIGTLEALGEKVPVDRIASYLGGFGNGESLDLVHLASLARCLATVAEVLGTEIGNETTAEIVDHIEKYRSADGAYSITAGSEVGDVYGCFMGLGAYEDLGRDVPDGDAIVARIRELRCADGGYANDQNTMAGSTPATAAALILLHRLASEKNAGAVQWLTARRNALGGFAPGPGLEKLGMTDLLSTATALHAMATVGVGFDDLREGTLDYLDSLWRPVGGFCGSTADEVVDCEYTFYGLLALGHLAG